jgi:flagellar protein FliJ
MTKFSFRLAGLLRLRQTACDQRRVQLAETQRTEADLHGQLGRIEVAQKQLQHDCREAAGPGTVDLRRLLEGQQYAATLRLRETELRRQRELLAAEIERRRQALIEADRDVRTLEKLRDNQLQTYRQAEQRQDAKRLDEAALQAMATAVVRDDRRSDTPW